MIDPSFGCRQKSITKHTDNQWVVFTDLDGTLLDHDTYSWQPAAVALDTLRQRRIPVVLVSSKTLSELSVYRKEIPLSHPVVAENGAAIDVPDGYFCEPLNAASPSIDRADLQRAYVDIRSSGSFSCMAFFELGDAGITEETGLSLTQARRANERKASEPILWQDSDERLAAFIAAAENRGLRCVQGGRFVHLMGATDKAAAMSALLGAYQRQWPNAKLISIVLGDGPNDLGMLRAADIAVIIPGRHGHPMPVQSPGRILRPTSHGPEGWRDAIQALLNE